jgi:hypothetical protein
MLKIKSSKTKMEDGIPIKEIKVDVDLVDTQAFFTKNGEDATCLELGKKLMKAITLNKAKENG